MPELFLESILATALLNDVGQCCHHIPRMGSCKLCSAQQGTPRWQPLSEQTESRAHTYPVSPQTALTWPDPTSEQLNRFMSNV